MVRKSAVLAVLILCLILSILSCKKKPKKQEPHIFDPLSLSEGSSSVDQAPQEEEKTVFKFEEAAAYIVITEINLDEIEALKIVFHDEEGEKLPFFKKENQLIFDKTLFEGFANKENLEKYRISCDIDPCDIFRAKIFIEYHTLYNGKLRQGQRTSYYLYSKLPVKMVFPKFESKEVQLGVEGDPKDLYNNRFLPEMLELEMKPDDKVSVKVGEKEHDLTKSEKKTVFTKGSIIKVTKKSLMPIKKDEVGKKPFKYQLVPLGEQKFETNIEVTNDGKVHEIKIQP